MRFDPERFDPDTVEPLLKHLASGETLGALLDQSPEAQKVMYHLAYTHYAQGKYTDAMRFFGFLVICDHWDRRYHMGMAACLQMQLQHADALKYYGIASMLDLTDPAPVMHIAECHLARGERPQARKALDYAIVQARAHAHHNHHVARLEAMLALLGSRDPEAAPKHSMEERT
ncbi:SycD/LcrH family type III secretion system chaperone [Variovorax soli]|uniref:Type III secretion system low calcium response chaperone LcrH/SycD n=1 Tax=Variovorax soli TaxID=376815 RepID=A0ABU1NEP3_9BURK|nr:SycD/LcrH family type III secretion system chaperone [Variovorax soli]MDR6536928.1 type III secretion system low calcium response chaperone LcrH/SycD [Variovorax soli]